MKKKISLFDKWSAKRRALKVWVYLTEHPEVRSKVYLPQRLCKLIRNDEHECPLCTLYQNGPICKGCPLNLATGN